MGFASKDYIDASQHKLVAAKSAHGHGLYQVAMYWSGVAVECVLRSHILNLENTIDSGHDIMDLFSKSKLLNLDSAYLARRGASHTNALAYQSDLKSHAVTVSRLWNNLVRYESLEKTRRRSLMYAKSIGKTKGDVLKVASEDLLESAFTLVGRGVMLWEK